MAANPKYIYTHLTTGTTTIKPTVGTLAAILVNKALTGTVTITDGTATIGILTNGTTAPLGQILYGGAGGIQFSSLKIALSATEDLTVVWE